MTTVTLRLQRVGEHLAVRLDAGSSAYCFDGQVAMPLVLALAAAWREISRSSFPSKDQCAHFGRELASQMLPGDVGQAFTWICSRALKDEGGACVVLQLEDESVQTLPWELLNLDGLPDSKDGFAALYPRIRMLRQLGGTGTNPEPPERLNVLVAYANPSTPNFPHLVNVDDEVTALRGVMARSGLPVDVSRLPNATPATLKREFALSQGPGGKPIHILHFVGHGRSTLSGHQIVLQGGRDEELVDATELASWAAGSGIRLVFLSACDSAGFAEELVRLGVPAAVGMQYAVRDEAQPNLVSEFYRELHRGKTFEEALAVARRSKRSDPSWWVPTLIARSSGRRVVRSIDDEEQNEFTPTNINFPADKFIGRTSEVSELETLLSATDPAVVAIVGLGGMGKTRLAKEVGNRLLPRFSDGVWLVDCSEFSSKEQFIAGIAGAIGVQVDSSDPLEGLVQVLGGQRLLLILDCFEGLVGSEAEEVIATLGGRAGLSVAVTSRVAPTGLANVHFLGPMAVSEQARADDDSVALFLDAAARANRNFRLRPNDLAIVSEICRDLEGIPLALQVAAARTPHVSLSDLREFALGTSSLADVLSQSLQLLPPADREMLMRLSVFAGTFSRKDAAAVLDLPDQEILEGIVSLCGYAMIQAESAGDRTRYRILDSIRQVLEHDSPVRSEDQVRHAEHFVQRAADLANRLFNADVGATEELWQEMPNLRSALNLAINENRHEWVAQISDTLLLPMMESGLWTEFEQVMAHAESACIEIGDLKRQTRILGLKGAIADRRKQADECVVAWERRVEMCAELGDLEGQADALLDLACREFTLGNFERCRHLLIEAEPVVQLSPRRAHAASSSVALGRVAIKLGDNAAAVRQAETTESRARGYEDVDGLMFVFTNLGHIYLDLDDLERALVAYRRVLEMAFGTGRRFHIDGALAGLYRTLKTMGRTEEGARCLIAAEKLSRVIPSKRRLETESNLREARRQLSGSASSLVFVELAASSWQDVVDDILERGASSGPKVGARSPT